jgi:hypothetical protein
MSDDAQSVGLLLSDDWLFNSRITATARACGRQIDPIRTVAELRDKLLACQPPSLFVDLSCPGLDVKALMALIAELSQAPIKVIVYGSHVDAAGLRKAREAGCDIVLPRSQFVQELPQQLVNWMGGT